MNNSSKSLARGACIIGGALFLGISAGTYIKLPELKQAEKQQKSIDNLSKRISNFEKQLNGTFSEPVQISSEKPNYFERVEDFIYRKYMPIGYGSGVLGISLISAGLYSPKKK